MGELLLFQVEFKKAKVGHEVWTQKGLFYDPDS